MNKIKIIISENKQLQKKHLLRENGDRDFDQMPGFETGFPPVIEYIKKVLEPFDFLKLQRTRYFNSQEGNFTDEPPEDNSKNQIGTIMLFYWIDKKRKERKPPFSEQLLEDISELFKEKLGIDMRKDQETVWHGKTREGILIQAWITWFSENDLGLYIDINLEAQDW